MHRFRVDSSRETHLALCTCGWRGHITFTRIAACTLGVRHETIAHPGSHRPAHWALMYAQRAATAKTADSTNPRDDAERGNPPQRSRRPGTGPRTTAA